MGLKLPSNKVLFQCILYVFCIATSCFTGCKENKIKATVRDGTITESSAITHLLLDSVFVENYISQNIMNKNQAQMFRNFYVSRNYQYAWFTEDGLAEQAQTFWNLRNHYLHFNKDSSLFDKKLEEQMLILTSGTNAVSNSKKDNREIELQLTRNFFVYAQYAYAGKINPEELQWFIPRKKIDTIAILDSLLINKKTKLQKWEPVNEQYALLQKQLLHYAELENYNTSWKQLELKGKLEKGDSNILIPTIKNRLFILGDLPKNDSSKRFDGRLELAVKKMQYRHGLTEDAVIGKNFITALNISPGERIQQILINMERMRWLPEINENKILIANIPEFKLHILENHKEVFQMNIVVGNAANNSVIITDILKYVVFSPYWNIPESITRNEIIPAMRRNSNYLRSKNMEITGYSNGIPIIRQLPGGSNSLGLVKFIFPNSYNIYFHDTPSKSLFKKEKRDFSHGCIRLEKPFELAKYLLQNESSWTDEKIKEAMQSKEEKWVNLIQPVQVFITYFTAWVDSDGILNFRNDVYGHDAKMKERLFR